MKTSGLCGGGRAQVCVLGTSQQLTLIKCPHTQTHTSLQREKNSGNEPIQKTYIISRSAVGFTFLLPSSPHSSSFHPFTFFPHSAAVVPVTKRPGWRTVGSGDWTDSAESKGSQITTSTTFWFGEGHSSAVQLRRTEGWLIRFPRINIWIDLEVQVILKYQRNMRLFMLGPCLPTSKTSTFEVLIQES